MRGLAIALGAALLGATAAVAQERPNGGAPSGCYRFAFGAWSPPLEWARAGHDSATNRYVSPPRPSGSAYRGADSTAPRESAMWDSSAAGESLLLFPSWWPAGVAVRFTLAAGRDSARGVARAFVADGRVEPPTSPVTVWRVPCARP